MESALHRKKLWWILQLAMVLLVLRVTVGIVLGYTNYFPLNFYSEFLIGRKPYFFGAYQYAFWIHILSSPLVVLSGLWLLSSTMRRRFASLHRRLGKVHILLVLFLVGPSGLWMSFYALTGWWAGSAFALSSSATMICAALGWRCAVKRRFREHQVWMTRCFLLLCSAIILRVLSGIATLLESDAIFTYPLFAWLSATVPLAMYEIARQWKLLPLNV